MTNQAEEAVIIVSHRSVPATARMRAESAGGLESNSDPLERLQSEVFPKLAAATPCPDVLGAPEDRMTALFQSWVAERTTSTEKRRAAASGLEAVLDERDWVGWATSFFTWVGKLAKHDLIEPSPQPTPIPETCRIALLGDWGSGLYGAPICSASIQRFQPAFDVIMHLGDVYYSGTPTEVRTRFLNLWPHVPHARNVALNSNHEMYSGGHGYFGQTLPAFSQPSSAIALQNDRWLLLGLDTGYEEHDLAGSQAEWIRGCVDRAGTRKVVLFSHHQPLSLFEKQGTKLTDRLGDLWTSGRIHAWYWGHEHRCVIYDRAGNGLYGRCVGHSGFPYFRETFSSGNVVDSRGDDRWIRVTGSEVTPSGIVLDGPNPHIAGYENEYGAHGWASLELAGDTLRERIHRADGSVIYEAELGA